MDDFSNFGFYGYTQRDLYPSEHDYFKSNPHVGGMATEDGRIIINPYSKLSAQEKQFVAKNEAMRLWMRDNNFQPDFQITPEQQSRFANTEYGNNPAALKQTLLARMLTNDPSAGKQTFEQSIWANKLAQQLNPPFQYGNAGMGNLNWLNK